LKSLCDEDNLFKLTVQNVNASANPNVSVGANVSVNASMSDIIYQQCHPLPFHFIFFLFQTLPFSLCNIK
jgi:hypothetical protein